MKKIAKEQIEKRIDVCVRNGALYLTSNGDPVMTYSLSHSVAEVIQSVIDARNSAFDFYENRD